MRERDEPLMSPGRRTALAAGLDVLVVAVFTLIGRRTHDEPLDPAGWWGTAWPFLAGLAIGWVVVAASSQTWPTRWWHGLTVWIATVFGGMALRDMVGQGTALSFVVVATVFLGVTLVGWRLVLWVVDRRRPEPTRTADRGGAGGARLSSTPGWVTRSVLRSCTVPPTGRGDAASSRPATGTAWPKSSASASRGRPRTLGRRTSVTPWTPPLRALDASAAPGPRPPSWPGSS